MEYSIGIIIYGNLLLVICLGFMMAASLLAAQIFSRRKMEEPQDSTSTAVKRNITFPLTNVVFCSTLEKGRLNYKKPSPKYNHQPRRQYGTQRMGLQNSR